MSAAKTLAVTRSNVVQHRMRIRFMSGFLRRWWLSVQLFIAPRCIRGDAESLHRFRVLLHDGGAIALFGNEVEPDFFEGNSRRNAAGAVVPRFAAAVRSLPLQLAAAGSAHAQLVHGIAAAGDFALAGVRRRAEEGEDRRAIAEAPGQFRRAEGGVGIGNAALELGAQLVGVG